jgi:hypothetical protein
MVQPARIKQSASSVDIDDAVLSDGDTLAG